MLYYNKMMMMVVVVMTEPEAVTVDIKKTQFDILKAIST